MLTWMHFWVLKKPYLNQIREGSWWNLLFTRVAWIHHRWFFPLCQLVCNLYKASGSFKNASRKFESKNIFLGKKTYQVSVKEWDVRINFSTRLLFECYLKLLLHLSICLRFVWLGCMTTWTKNKQIIAMKLKKVQILISTMFKCLKDMKYCGKKLFQRGAFRRLSFLFNILKLIIHECRLLKNN